MKKKLLCLTVTAFILILSLFPAYAISENGYIFDYLDLISETAETKLNEEAAAIEDTCNIRFLFALKEDGTDINTLSEDVYSANSDSSKGTVVLAITDDYYLFRVSDSLNSVFDKDTQNAVWDAYANADTYYDGIHNALTYIYNNAVRKNGMLATEEADLLFANHSRLVDDQDLLTDEQEQTVISALDDASQNTQIDIVVLTTDELNEINDREYCDDYFDYNNYGTGTDRSGILLAFDAVDGLWYISTRGEAISIFTDSGTDYLFDLIRGSLKAEDYVTAFSDFAKYCEDFTATYRTQGIAITGKTYTKYELFMQKLPKFIVISLFIGLFVAFVIVNGMKNKLKSVRMNATAANYVKEGSMHLTENRDMFLYNKVTSQPKPKQSSGGGSHTHTSSSGASHGGHGGRL